jgi:hypothetical protein
VDDDDAPVSDDVVLICGAAEHGDGATVLRRRSGAVEVGELRPAADGRPIHGELVRLRRRPEHERLYDVEVLHDARADTRGGPPQVATRAYRAGWDSAFGRPKAEPS